MISYYSSLLAEVSHDETNLNESSCRFSLSRRERPLLAGKTDNMSIISEIENSSNFAAIFTQRTRQDNIPVND